MAERPSVEMIAMSSGLRKAPFASTCLLREYVSKKNQWPLPLKIRVPSHAEKDFTPELLNDILVHVDLANLPSLRLVSR